MLRLNHRDLVAPLFRSFVACALGAFLLGASLTDLYAEEGLRLVTGNDYKPFTDESLPEGGLANEIVKRSYDQIGVKYSIEWKPWKRGFR